MNAILKPVPDTAPLLDVAHVRKTFPRGDGPASCSVLEDVSVKLAAGEIVGLLGRSGSGKVDAAPSC